MYIDPKVLNRINRLRADFKQWHASQLTHDELLLKKSEFFNDIGYSDRQGVTASNLKGKPLLSNSVKGAYNGAWWTLSQEYFDSNMSDYITFGYWYKGDFYTTSKYLPQLKSTNALHKLGLKQSEWDKMDKGHFWTSSLKRFF